MKQELIITQQVLYILLALYIKDRHGYDIMKEVSKFSKGQIKMGPGTLYGALKRLLDTELIEEIKEENPYSSERRRYYRITKKGKSILSSEVEKMNHTIELAKSINLLNSITEIEYV